MQPQSLVFEYFFQIGAGAALGIASVVIPSRLLYLWIAGKMTARTRKGEMD